MARPKKATPKNASMKVKVPGATKSIDRMKYEIANEFGVNLGASASSRDNGIVGGEMTKRLVEHGMNKNTNKSTNSHSRTSSKKRSRKTK